MKLLWGIVACLALGTPATLALPSAVFEQALADVAKRADNNKVKQRRDKRFNEDQRIDTSGVHKFIPPGKGDLRGPCPGLNAMANHGYLPRNGFATIDQIASANIQVFAMGKDLAYVLAAYGAAMDGLGVGWSIGGHRFGIGGSHNNYETDSSPVRGDLHQYGNSRRPVMSQFKRLLALQESGTNENYGLDVLREFRKVRFADSIEKNPWFYYAPFSGAVVSQAAYSFIPRFMANKSREFPNGILTREHLKSFYSIVGEGENMRWVPGHDRFPDNWYSRNQKEPYNVNYLSDDIDYLAVGQPEITKPGCNTGKVNSYHQINTTDEAGKPVGEGNPVCLGMAYMLQSADRLGVVKNVLEQYTLVAQNALGCSTIPDLDKSAGEACPGYSLYGGPRGKVAPGAIQDE